jgi:hypothetical protein
VPQPDGFLRRGNAAAAITHFCAHYHSERNHQGLGNRLIEPGENVGQVAGDIVCEERLGGLLKYYRRKAA